MTRAARSVSVVVPVRNGADTLEAQLAALAPQLRSADEVIIADNGSTDATQQVTAHFAALSGANVRWIDASSVTGVSHARNAGVAAATGEVILICDADDIVGKSWRSAMLDYLADADMVGGALEVHSLNAPSTRDWRRISAPDQLPHLLGFLPYAVGCNVGIWREVALSVGGWDETLHAGGDDVDFSWRVQLAGFRLVPGPKALVAYRLRDTIRGAMRQGFAYGRAESGIYQRYAGQGLRVPPLRARARDVALTALALRRVIRGRAATGKALFTLALNWGKLLATKEFSHGRPASRPR